MKHQIFQCIIALIFNLFSANLYFLSLNYGMEYFYIISRTHFKKSIFSDGYYIFLGTKRTGIMTMR